MNLVKTKQKTEGNQLQLENTLENILDEAVKSPPMAFCLILLELLADPHHRQYNNQSEISGKCA